MDLESIMLREKDKNHDFTHVWNMTQKVVSTPTIQTHRYRQWNSGYQRIKRVEGG